MSVKHIKRYTCECGQVAELTSHGYGTAYRIGPPLVECDCGRPLHFEWCAEWDLLTPFLQEQIRPKTGCVWLAALIPLVPVGIWTGISLADPHYLPSPLGLAPLLGGLYLATIVAGAVFDRLVRKAHAADVDASRARLQDPAYVANLVQLYQGNLKNPELARDATIFLGKLGSAALPVLPLLLERAQSSSPGTFEHAEVTEAIAAITPSD